MFWIPFALTVVILGVIAAVTGIATVFWILCAVTAVIVGLMVAAAELDERRKQNRW